jgi:hypothetical protein
MGSERILSIGIVGCPEIGDLSSAEHLPMVL